MKGVAFVFSLLISFSSSSFAACGPSFEATAPLLNTAAHDLYGFGYVHSAIEKMQAANPGSEICLTGLMLSKDIYQYGQYYIQADVRSKMDRSVLYRMRFLFQDASTQAFQNMNQQPWTVVDTADVDSILNLAVRDAKPIPLGVDSSDALVMAQASKTYQKDPAEEGTLMAIPLKEIAGIQKPHMVSWLTRQTGNIFAVTQQTRGVITGFDAPGHSIVVENIWVYQSLTSPLETSLLAHVPEAGSDLVSALLRSASSAPAFLSFFSVKLLEGRF